MWCTFVFTIRTIYISRWMVLSHWCSAPTQHDTNLPFMFRHVRVAPVHPMDETFILQTDASIIKTGVDDESCRIEMWARNEQLHDQVFLQKFLYINTFVPFVSALGLRTTSCLFRRSQSTLVINIYVYWRNYTPSLTLFSHSCYAEIVSLRSESDIVCYKTCSNVIKESHNRCIVRTSDDKT